MTDGSVTAVRAAQAASIFVNATTAGASLGLSALLIPRFLEAPTPLMLRQWSNMFERTRRPFPAAAAAAAAGYFALAYYYAFRTATGAVAGRLYALSGSLCIGIVPYTLVLIMPTNKKLFAKVDEVNKLGLLAQDDVDNKAHITQVKGELVETGQQKEETAKYLVDHWGILNVGRAGMLAAAAAIGLWVSL